MAETKINILDVSGMQQKIILIIETELKRTIEEKYEAHKKAFIEQLDREKAQTLASVTLFIMKQIDYKTIGENLVITLQTREVKDK